MLRRCPTRAWVAIAGAFAAFLPQIACGESLVAALARRFADSEFAFMRAQSNAPLPPAAWVTLTGYEEVQVTRTDFPLAAVEFQQATLSQGAFRMFMFEALTGTVNYSARRVDMDVRLQQTPQAWITAKGTAPLALFQPNPVDAASRPADGGGPVDIQVASSQIDLGIVQGFTSYVTDVTGTM